MKTHLLPAGYEFQKVLDDYERLRSGKELLDRGALKALAERDDNNARYDLLERFRDYVLPNYDDPRSVYPEIKDQLVAAVVATRQTKPRPRETPFGNFPGIAADRIVEIVCDILVHYRYVDIDITFDAICEFIPAPRAPKNESTSSRRRSGWRKMISTFGSRLAPTCKLYLCKKSTASIGANGTPFGPC